MSHEAFAVTDVGLEREHNEDCVLVDDELGLFVVCDGMGGHACGEVASSIASQSVRRVVAGQRAMIDALASGHAPPDALAGLLRHALEVANTEVHDAAQADSEKRGMGTTCTALLLCGGYGVLAHVGDSQLHLLRDEASVQLSADHTFTAEAVRRGAMTEEQAAESGHGNVLMRCVGTQDAVQVDTLVFDVVANDMLVLCSDGLSQYLKNSQELARLWGGRSPKDFTRALITVANARGGSDNVSVICVRPDSSLPMGATPGPPAPAAVAGRRNAAIAATNPPRSRAREPVLVTLDTLRGIHVMAALSAQEVMLLRQVFRERSFGVGAYITREGEVGTEMFVLLEGLAEVLRGGERVAELGPGAHFGEMALLNDKPRAASVLTMSACRTLVCGRGELSDLLTEHPTLAARFYRELACALSTRLDDIYAFYDKGDTQVADEEPGRARTTLFHGSGHHGH